MIKEETEERHDGIKQTIGGPHKERDSDGDSLLHIATPASTRQSLAHDLSPNETGLEEEQHVQEKPHQSLSSSSHATPKTRRQNQHKRESTTFCSVTTPLSATKRAGSDVTINFETRDEDGNPVLEAPESRTWSQWWKYYKPCIMVTAFTFIKTSAAMMVLPLVPFLLKDYYGGGEQGTKEAAVVQTTSDAVRAIVAMLMVPCYGKLLDTMGRKPFFCLVAVLACIPPACLWWNDKEPLWFIFFNQIVLAFSNTYTLAYIADSFAENERSKVIAVSTGIGTLGLLFGVSVLLLASAPLIYVISMFFSVLLIPLTFFMTEESLPQEAKKPFRLAYLNPNPLPSVRLLTGNKVLKAITAVIAMLVATSIGTSEILSFFLMNRMGWTADDNKLIIMEAGLLMPIALLVAYPLVKRKLRHTRIIFLALLLVIASMVVLMISTEKWMVFMLVVPLGMGSEIGLPSLLGIFANAGEQTTQGQRNAGLTAILDFVKALSPVIIGQLFHALPTRLSWMSLMACLCFSLPALPLTWSHLPRWVAEDRDRQIRSGQQGSGSVTEMKGVECAHGIEDVVNEAERAESADSTSE